jgi:hypothetical protein
LWSEQTRKAALVLADVIANMHVNYRGIAELFLALSKETYANVIGFAQNQSWPLPLE